MWTNVKHKYAWSYGIHSTDHFSVTTRYGIHNGPKIWHLLTQRYQKCFAVWNQFIATISTCHIWYDLYMNVISFKSVKTWYDFSQFWCCHATFWWGNEVQITWNRTATGDSDEPHPMSTFEVIIWISSGHWVSPYPIVLSSLHNQGRLFTNRRVRD